MDDKSIVKTTSALNGHGIAWDDPTITYNHFENKFTQLRHPENPTIDTKIVKIGPWTPKICHFRFTVGGHLGFGRKRGLKGSKNLNPMIFLLFDP